MSSENVDGLDLSYELTKAGEEIAGLQDRLRGVQTALEDGRYADARELASGEQPRDEAMPVAVPLDIATPGFNDAFNKLLKRTGYPACWFAFGEHPDRKGLMVMGGGHPEPLAIAQKLMSMNRQPVGLEGSGSRLILPN